MLILKGESLPNLQESFPLPAAKQWETSYLYTSWQFFGGGRLGLPLCLFNGDKASQDRASVPLWIFLEAEPKMRIQVQVLYLGGDPTKH